MAPATDDDAKWIHIFVNEGQDDGIFYYWVDANKDFTPRTGNILFTVNGNPAPTLFRIDQEAAVPTITIASADKGYEILPAGGQVKIPVRHNVDFTATLNPASWAKIDSVGSDTVYVSATKNTDEARKATLTLTGTGDYANVKSKDHALAGRRRSGDERALRMDARRHRGLLLQLSGGALRQMDS